MGDAPSALTEATPTSSVGVVNWKTVHNLQFESHVSLSRCAADASLEAASQRPWRDHSVEAGGGEPGETGVCSTAQVVRTSKDSCQLKRTQTSQGNELRAFLCVGRCKSLGSLKLPLLMCLPLSYLGPGSCSPPS